MKKRLAPVLILLLSGCFHAEPEPEPWGLGLDTSKHPEPAPFSEGAADLTHLFAFANASIEAMYGRCKTGSQGSWVSDQAGRWNMKAFDHLIDACDKEDRLVAKAEADAAIANGTVDEIVSRYENRSRPAVERVRTQVRNLPLPGTYADAEFIAWIQETFTSSAADLRLSSQSLAAYKANMGQPFNELNLDEALIGFRAAERTMDALEYFIQNYEWRPGTCSIPAASDVFARNMARLNASLERAAMVSDPEDAKTLSHPYGFALKNLKPRMEGAHRNGWPLLLLWQQPEVDAEVAYWENYTQRPLPTLEEAEYLVAMHHATVRSLPTEPLWDEARHWVTSAQYVGNYYDDNVFFAVTVLALQAVEWPFAELDCRPSP